MEPRYHLSSAILARILLLLFLLAAVPFLFSQEQQELRPDWRREVKFHTAVEVGGVAIPAGNYTIRHVPEGKQHIMLFQQNRKPNQQFRVSCMVVMLPEKARQTQQLYNYGPAGGKILVALIFKGEDVRHVF
jgi:hypothetical protein